VTYSGQVLDVAVSAVLGTAGDGAGALAADFGFELGVGAAGVDVDGLGTVGLMSTLGN